MTNTTQKKTTTFNKVILIDDDATSNAFFDKISRIANLTEDLISIEDPIEAIQYLKEINQKDSPDAIFIDVEMPVLDGWEVLENIRSNQKLKKTKVFIMTNSLDYKHEQKSEKDERVSLFLQKPLGLHMIRYLGHKYS